MTHTLTDTHALQAHRTRATRAPVTFLHEHAVDEVKDRLSLVNKSFTKAGIVTGMPEFWASAFPEAKVVPDTETLDLALATHDLIIHAMCLHWANDPVGQMIQAQRALKPDGLFLAVLFGGNTLQELRAALGQAETEVMGGLSPRIAPMGEIRDMGALLQRAGFALPVADSLPLKVSYASPLHLMHELRYMGEANAMSARHREPMRRALLQKTCDIYTEAFSDVENRITATFDLIFLTGWKPDASQPQPLRPGSATNRLAEALGTKETKLND